MTSVGEAPFPPQMGQPYQPWNVLLFVIPSAEWYGPVVFLHLVLLGWLAYRFLRRVGCKHESALLGLVCAVLGIWLQGRVHQNVVISAALPLFLMLSCVHELFFGRRHARAVGTLAIAVGISWSGGFAPVSLQSTYLAGALGLAFAISRRRWRPFVLVVGGIALGGVISLAQMGPVMLAAAETARGTPTADQLAGIGLDFGNLVTLVWPDLLFWAAPGQFSDGDTFASLALIGRLGMTNFTEMGFSTGLASVLAVVALVGRSGADAPPHRRMLVWLFAGCALLAFLIATTKTPWLELTAIIPGARSGDLRRFLFTVHIGLVVLAAFGADRLAAGERGRPAIFAGLVAAASLALVLFHLRGPAAMETAYAELLASLYSTDVETVRTVIRPGQVEANRAHAIATGVRALVISLAALFVFVRARGWAVPLLCSLAVVELLNAGAGNRLAVPVERITTPPEVLAPVLEATRVAADGPRPRLMVLGGPEDVPPIGLFVANLPGYWGVEHLGAYNPLPKRRMEELFKALEPDREGKRSIAFGGGGSGIDALRDPASVDHPLLDLLGASWILASADCTSSPPRGRDTRRRA